VFSPAFKVAPVLIDVLRHFGWSRVGVVTGHTPEDFSAARTFEAAARASGIEILGTASALSDSSEAMEELVEYINRDLPNIRVWIMFFAVRIRSD
jgi:hypothetical protein